MFKFGVIVGVGLDVYEGGVFEFEELCMFENVVLLLYMGLVMYEVWVEMG